MNRQEAIEELEILNARIQQLARRRQAILQSFGQGIVRKQPQIYQEYKKPTKRFPRGRVVGYYS